MAAHILDRHQRELKLLHDRLQQSRQTVQPIPSNSTYPHPTQTDRKQYTPHRLYAITETKPKHVLVENKTTQTEQKTVKFEFIKKRDDQTQTDEVIHDLRQLYRTLTISQLLELKTEIEDMIIQGSLKEIAERRKKREQGKIETKQEGIVDTQFS